ncbi:lipase member H [Trichonephila clavipes]|nr:lipase member H [Trichonephila clavipes]
MARRCMDVIECITFCRCKFPLPLSMLLLPGYGSKGPDGDLDFYPNGGDTQPRCSREELDMDPESDSDVLSMRVCNHNSAVIYFLQSVNATDCRFLATECDNYDDFQNGLCPPPTSIVSEMGLRAKMIPELPPKSKFYLKTSANPPYCLQDGYEPS